MLESKVDILFNLRVRKFEEFTHKMIELKILIILTPEKR